jgi:hypothetical protein
MSEKLLESCALPTLNIEHSYLCCPLSCEGRAIMRPVLFYFPGNGQPSSRPSISRNPLVREDEHV